MYGSSACACAVVRRISACVVLSKLFEKLLLARLSSQSAKIHPLQGGFRPKTSCIHTAFILQEAIRHTRFRGKKVFIAFLDIKKAYDTVWHKGLLLKLLQYNFPSYIWTIIKNWYSDCSAAVLWNSSTSRSFQINQGVRQGSVLSPFLYTIFVNDLLVKLSESGHGVKIGEIYCGSPMFADDLALIDESPAGLQQMLDIVSAYAMELKYEFNANKSAILVIGESKHTRETLRPTT